MNMKAAKTIIMTFMKRINNPIDCSLCCAHYFILISLAGILHKFSGKERHQRNDHEGTKTFVKRAK